MTERRAVAICMVALYLRGAPRRTRPPRGRAVAVTNWLRQEGASIGGAEHALRRAGCWEEALALAEPGLLAWAERIHDEGHALTWEDDAYPDGWRRDRIGVPTPAVWVLGSPLDGSGPGGLCDGGAARLAERTVAVVGSRQIDDDVARWVDETVREAVRAGLRIVSGGAPGCDRQAGRTALEGSLSGAADDSCADVGHLVVVAPCGLSRLGEFLSWDATSTNSTHKNLAMDPTLAAYRDGDPRVTFISAQAPEEGFSRAAAMERNALVYAFGAGTIVAHARFREGGTWHGAVDALRRRRRVVVRTFDDRDAYGSDAARALVALGGLPAGSPADAVACFTGGLGAHRHAGLEFDEIPTVRSVPSPGAGGKYTLAS